jgi:peptidoglycan/xylan/chitin deacetylase (PgdA/CDA1 family)
MKSSERRRVKRMVFLLISGGYWIVRSGYQAILRGGGELSRRETPVVLTYHSVTAEDLPRFERQMREVRRSTRPVFADEFTSVGRGRCVALTFDDAFQDVFDVALPVLALHDIVATIFVPTGYLDADPGWIVGRSVPGKVVSRATLEALDRRRVRLGSHTVTHPRLAELEYVALQCELSESMRTLEDVTRGPITMLALPYGSCSANVLSTAKESGYERVFANVPVRNGAAKASVLVGRVDVSPQDWPVEFRLKLYGAYEWLAWAVLLKRAVRRVVGLQGRV